MKDIAGNFINHPTSGACTNSYEMRLPAATPYSSTAEILISINGSELKSGIIKSAGDVRYDQPRHILIRELAEIFIYKNFIEVLSAHYLQEDCVESLTITVYELHKGEFAECATTYTLGKGVHTSLQGNQSEYSKSFQRIRREVLSSEVVPFNHVHLTKLTSEGTEPVLLSEVKLIQSSSYKFHSKYRVTSRGPLELHKSSQVGKGHTALWVGWIVGDRLNFECTESLESFSVNIPKHSRNPMLGFSGEGTPWYGYITEFDELVLESVHVGGIKELYTVPNVVSAQISVKEGVVSVLGGGYD